MILFKIFLFFYLFFRIFAHYLSIKHLTNMKKFILLCGSILLCVTSLSAQQTWDCGANGNNVTATLSGNTLTISGTGNMADYNGITAPWYGSRTSIQTIIIDNNVTSIGNWAFYNCNSLTSIDIPNSVTSIGSWAFQNCSSLTSVDIPDGVVSIGISTFNSCSSLTSVTIGNSLKSTGKEMFLSCRNLTSVTIGSGLTSIEEYTFSGCNNLSSIVIPNSVTFIGNYAFCGCSLTSVSIPENVAFIGNYAFGECSSLTSIDFPNNVKSIGDYVFYGCSNLTSIDIPNNVKSIGDYVFYGCSNLTTIHFNAINCTTIGIIPFYDCNNVKEVIVGNEVENIPANAFQGCNNLNSITIHAETPPTLAENAFSCPRDVPVHIPCSANNPYPASWNYFTNYIRGIPDTTYYSATKCYGQPYTDANFTELNNPGIYYATLDNVNHCDSIVCLMLSEYPYSSSAYQVSICQGSTYSDANFTDITAAGTYQVTLQNANGCDSIVYLQLSYINSPSTQELCMISVDKNYHNQIVWKRQEEIVAYNIYRESNIAGQYELVQTIPYENENSWIDTKSDARVRSHSYKISAIDTCGNESELSAPHKTMHLLINQGVGDSWNLIWTPYEGMEYSTYNIYRTVGDSEPTLISTVPASLTSFTDFTSTGDAYVYYVIEIVLNDACEISAPQQVLQLKSASASSFGSIRSNIATNNPNGVTGIFEILCATPSLQVYPNPTKGIVHIATESNLHIKVYNAQGVLLQNVFGNQVDLSGYHQSMYLLQVGEKWVKVMKK